ncbi:adenosylcobinamide-GDP ribazoletransferase [Paenibacillus radicis (ex Gao et al. 2016)]|uniref:Adenosylcobinamide-GDP ribazoletransferase n=1 Tax=Paenibacillus radicis (ex Gao et al. 2016) TaxID=1737354 RepID=A0A917M677_9BACL|nr:adenosylcobinamide-GDP ribazoletransferase [Paenibacillus radicis (ex Gao et al. 2016)]GGG79916.1 adenosylcobinamide-GDP ribazoletransferase [Paenibacillus radicis (ex Gao et al. 2016)]
MVFRSLIVHGQALIAAIQFLTRVPVPVQVPFEPKQLSRSIIYFPAAGAIVGAVSAICFGLLSLFMPALPAAVIVLAVWTAMSGGLHLDGWMDTADGVLSHRSRERMLEIMKDSRVGAMGVIAAVLLLLFKFAVLSELIELGLENGSWWKSMALIASAPIWSRWWMSAAIVGWPSARKGEGIGAMFRAAGPRQMAAGFLLAVALTLVIAFAGGIPLEDAILWCAGAAFITAAVGLITATWLSRKLGGLTGDTYGAMNEAVEAVLILAVLLVLK